MFLASKKHLQRSRKIALLIKHFIYKGRFMVLSRRQEVL